MTSGEHPGQLTPHSFTEIPYITTNPHNLNDERSARILNSSLEEWIRNVALPRRVGHFATFNVIEGIVSVGSTDRIVRSERYGLSGITYIDGVVCDPTASAILEGLSSVTLNRTIYPTDEGFIGDHLATLRRNQQTLDHVVIDRRGDAFYAFDTTKDAILRSDQF